ncbi:SIMPL domain-containing protein [Sabulicella glaciei]|uniref:SIMPL domain-containing protein n=1 Tax=Sabulicella glaciei TaxID=2984948 RepID=A0ABT3NQW8_9PROT|nr:SIMPL domain-containing protein [Roseococcus sp. MDT2-1-1]
MNPRRALLALPLLLAPLPAMAQETKLRLSESATLRRAPDEPVAMLRAEARATSAAAAQAAVNRSVAVAVEQAQRVQGLRVTTGRYATHRSEEQRLWLAVQSITLRGGEASTLADLVGTLQSQGLALDMLGAQLSDEAERELREQATREAIRLLRARAEIVAAELGLRVSHLAELSIDMAHDGPRPMMAASAMRAAPSPVSLPEEAPVTVRASAEAILLPR